MIIRFSHCFVNISPADKDQQQTLLMILSFPPQKKDLLNKQCDGQKKKDKK
jgi:hypothetical protein